MYNGNARRYADPEQRKYTGQCTKAGNEWELDFEKYCAPYLYTNYHRPNKVRQHSSDAGSTEEDADYVIALKAGYHPIVGKPSDSTYKSDNEYRVDAASLEKEIAVFHEKLVYWQQILLRLRDKGKEQISGIVVPPKVVFILYFLNTATDRVYEVELLEATTTTEVKQYPLRGFTIHLDTNEVAIGKHGTSGYRVLKSGFFGLCTATQMLLSDPYLDQPKGSCRKTRAGMKELDEHGRETGHYAYPAANLCDLDCHKCSVKVCDYNYQMSGGCDRNCVREYAGSKSLVRDDPEGYRMYKDEQHCWAATIKRCYAVGCNKNSDEFKLKTFYSYSNVIPSFVNGKIQVHPIRDAQEDKYIIFLCKEHYDLVDDDTRSPK